jgi:homogentisate 1,2-dioxygenase
VRIKFGAGASDDILSELDAMGARKVLLVCTPGRKADGEAFAARLGARSVGGLAIAREHVPAEVVAEGTREAERLGADVVLALGGGSAIGLAKAIAIHAPVRVVAVPTTYSGSEMTPIYGITEAGEKRTARDERARPALVVYDPRLTVGLPRAVIVSSLWNAIAHAIEALWVDTDRATRVVAEEALRLLFKSSPWWSGAMIADDAGAREDALEGAFLAGAAFGDAGSGLHHKLCHVLGGAFGLPHAATHAVVLPHVVRFHREAAPEAMSAIARALRVIDPVLGLERLARSSGAPASLAKLGMPHDGIARVVDAMLALPVLHPRALDRDALTTMLEAAYAEPVAPQTPPPIRGPSELSFVSGFGSTHESEALPGALPRRQNAPRIAPYGLYPELLSGTPFTVESAENSRVWMYRIRASFSHGVLTPLPAASFLAPLEAVEPNRTRWRPLPIPEGPAQVDFLDGLVTLGGAGDETSGPGYGVHIYAANADMKDRCFSSADGDLLIVPQTGTLEVQTELGWLRVGPGSILLVPRSLKFAIGVPDGAARGWMLEVFGRRFRLPERGLIGSNGLADARHFLAPTAAYEDRTCPSGFQSVVKLGGQLFAATQAHSPFDVVAWHGNHAPFTYDLSLFSAMGSVTFDHPDPSILTVLTAPLDDHGRAIADFVVFPGRWDVLEHSFRPPFMHRNAASEINGVVRTPSPEAGYEPGVTFISPLLASHGVATKTYDHVLGLSEEAAEGPRRLSDESLWIMFESALPFRTSKWARDTPLVDAEFAKLWEGMRSRFDPTRP